jgi:hypothetical protein
VRENKGEFLVLLETGGDGARRRNDRFKVSDFELFVDAVEVKEGKSEDKARGHDDQYHQQAHS